MKNILHIAALAIMTIGCGVLFPQWWLVALISFALAMIFNQSMSTAALISFLTVGLIWIGTSWYIDSSNDSILSSRIGELFKMDSMGMILITGLIGGLVAGLGGWTGASLRRLIG